MNRLIPFQDDVVDAVTRVFTDTAKKYPIEILNALVAIDNEIALGYTSINYIVDQEMQEVCELVNDLNLYAIKEDLTNSQRTRARILAYCHIVEAHLPLVVLWNLLRILSHQPCSWTFYRITEKGDSQICIYPKDKIAAISQLSQTVSQPIGHVLYGLWHPELRNSFAHSQYIMESAHILTTGQLSPISRRAKKPLSQVIRYSFLEIEQLFVDANCFFETFIASYKSAIKSFKDGKPHKIQAGLIEWSPRGTWIWSKG